MFEVDLTVAKW